MSAPSGSTGPFRFRDSPVLGAALGVAVATGLWVFVMLIPRGLFGLELQSQRLMLQYRGEQAREPNEPRIVIVARDDASYEYVEAERGEAPGEWSREVYALLLQRLRQAGVAAVGFDFVFDSDKKGTPEFARALAEKPDNVVAMIQSVDFRRQKRAGNYRLSSMVVPIEPIAKASRLGNINAVIDIDERARRYIKEVVTPAKVVIPTLALALADRYDPLGAGARREALEVDYEGTFLLDMRAPTPAFETVSMRDLLDPSEFFKLSWATSLVGQELGNQRIEVGPRERGDVSFTLAVSPPDLEVEVLVLPAAPGPWGRAAGKARLKIDGLRPGLHDVYVARKLGENSWGILHRGEVDPVAGTPPVVLPKLQEPLTGGLVGEAGPTRVTLRGTGLTIGEDHYTEQLVVEAVTPGRFRTPRCAEEDFFGEVNGLGEHPVSRGVVAELPTLPTPPSRPGGAITVTGAAPGSHALMVERALPLPPYRATLPFVGAPGGASVELPPPPEDFYLLVEDQDGSRGQALANVGGLFQDALVLVGPTSALDQDFVTTPFDHLDPTSQEQAGGKTPGVEIHANALRTALMKRPVTTPTGLSSMISPFIGQRLAGQLPLLVLLVVLCGGLGAAIKWAMPRGGILMAIGGGLAYETFVYTQLAWSRAWWHDVVPLVGITLTYVVILWVNYNTVEAQRRQIRATFQHYLDPDIVKELENNPDALALGGDQQIVTCFFSDIEGFSSFSEQMTPNELVDFINEYLTAMSDILLKYGGWLDKFIGDAIVAVFNAPRSQPDHAYRCVLAALEMKQREARLRAEWAERGLPPVKTRIGINTGNAVVGNVGTGNRKNYTILGDAVNLAARLEALNKSYGTYLMIGEATRVEVVGRFEMRELDLVAVKGKKKPSSVWEVVALAGEGSENWPQSKEIWDLGLSAYRTRRFTDAEKHFERLLELMPEDAPSRMYIERITLMRKQPPPADWDGVWRMEHK